MMNGHVDRIPPDPLERFRFLKKDKNLRKNTFKNFKEKDIKIDDFVNLGFIYVGSGSSDEVQCTHCGGILKGFEKGDRLDTEHQRHFPNCPNLDRTESDAVDQMDMASLNLDDGVFLVTVDGKPKRFEDHTNKRIFNKNRFQQFRSYEARLKSFEDKWLDNFKVKAEDCAKAGLFYTGTEDLCVCVYCGGQLDCWDEGDEPITEHDSNFQAICGFCDLPEWREPNAAENR